MARSLSVLTAVFVVLWAALGAAQAEKRVALVIGNSTYASTALLANPARDAADIAASLERLGFQVRRETNLGSEAMRKSLRDFGETAAAADVALVYFAGHGMEVGGQNYLIPVDARLKSDRDLAYEAIALDLVMAAVEGAKGLRMVLLDACRDNPFANSMQRTSTTRSVGRGLTRVEPAVGTLVGFAAKEGTTADDGEGRNSPYAVALLAYIEEPGLEVNFLFRKVRDHVVKATGGRQEPFTYGSLPAEQLFLVPPAQSEAQTGKEAAVDPSPAPDTAAGEPADVRAIQQELLRHNCAPGAADGVWGDRSRRAAQSFVSVAKLDLAPEPSPGLLLELRGRSTPACVTAAQPVDKAPPKAEAVTEQIPPGNRRILCIRGNRAACRSECRRGNPFACKRLQLLGG